MTADPHTDDARNQAITLRYLAARTDRSMPGIAEHVREAAATIDALAARLEAAERDRDRQQERVDYLFRTHPSEWEPEVIRWLSPAVRAGWEGSENG